jgi:hypothetical protein
VTTPKDEQREPGDLDLDPETVKDLDPTGDETDDVRGGVIGYATVKCGITVTIQGCAVASGGCTG